MVRKVYTTAEEFKLQNAQLNTNLPYSENVAILSESVQVGGKTIPNRFVCQAMEGCDGTATGEPDQLTRRRYDRFAKGGAGLIASKSKASVLPIHIKTKDYRIKAFRKVTLIIGDPIPYEEYTKGGELEGDSRAITQYIFDRIIALGKEEAK